MRCSCSHRHLLQRQSRLRAEESSEMSAASPNLLSTSGSILARTDQVGAQVQPSDQVTWRDSPRVSETIVERLSNVSSRISPHFECLLSLASRHDTVSSIDIQGSQVVSLNLPIHCCRISLAPIRRRMRRRSASGDHRRRRRLYGTSIVELQLETLLESNSELGSNSS